MEGSASPWGIKNRHCAQHFTANDGEEEEEEEEDEDDDDDDDI
jgi:hypothetical protein